MSQYSDLGVDPHKGIVKQIFGGLIKKEFPFAFINMCRSRTDPKRIITKHADGSGSKTVTRILYWLVTGDPGYLQGDPFDAWAMNGGDIAAAGFVYDPWEITDIIDVSPLDIDKEVYVEQVAKGIAELLALYEKYGFEIDFFGGETADLVDQTRSAILNMDIRSETDEADIIKGEIREGDVIFGFRSDGQAVWENEPNSGIMSNGQTMGRKKLLREEYTRLYTSLCNPQKPFQGRYKITDFMSELGMTIGEALISNTRQWPIVTKFLISKLWEMNVFSLLHGISMNTGGGLSKCGNLGRGIRYELSVSEIPPIFHLIQQESGENWPGMLITFNCGIGLTVIGSPEGGFLEEAVANVSKKTGVESLFLGVCSKSCNDGRNEVFVSTPDGTFGDLLEEG